MVCNSPTLSYEIYHVCVPHPRNEKKKKMYKAGLGLFEFSKSFSNIVDCESRHARVVKKKVAAIKQKINMLQYTLYILTTDDSRYSSAI